MATITSGSPGQLRQDSGRQLEGHLTRLRRLLLTVGGLTGLLWGLAAAVVLVLAVMWLDLLWELTPKVRAATWYGAAGLWVVLLFLLAWWAHRRGAPQRVASRLDQAGCTGGQIRSGLDLMQMREGSNLRQGLAQLAVAKAAGLARATPAGSVVSLRGVARGLISLAVLGGVLGVVVFGAPRLARTQWLRFSQPWADHPPYSAIEFEIEPGDVEVVYGDSLDVYGTLHGPTADRVALILVDQEGNEETLPMFQETSERWRTVLAQVTEPAAYYLQAGRSRSHKYNITVGTVPRLGEVRFRVIQPAYAQRPEFEGALPKEGLAGLAGTQVQVWATSNRPLGGGKLVLTSGGEEQIIELSPVSASGEEVTGTFTIEANGKLELNVIDVAGQASRESLAGSFTLLEDQRPMIRLVQPQLESLATPGAVVPVVVIAEDDCGIDRLQLYRSLNQSRPLPYDAPLEGHPLKLDEQTVLPFSAYGLSPGDEVRLFARVEDNDPAGAKGAESAIAIIRVISEEELQAMLEREQALDMLMSKYEQARRRLERLREEIRELAEQAAEEAANSPDGEISAELSEKLADLAKQLEQELAENEAFREEELPLDVDASLDPMLGQVSELLAELQEKAEAMGGDPKPSSTLTEEELAAMEQMLSEALGEYQEQVSEPLENLEAVYPLLENAMRFILLAKQQRELADRAAALRGAEDRNDPAEQARMEEMGQEQERIRLELIDLLNEIEQQAEDLPDDPELEELRYSAFQFVDAVFESGATDAMANVELAFAEHDGTHGHNQAVRAAELLEQFIDDSEGLAGQCQGACQLKFAPGMGKLGNTLGQLLQAAGMIPGGQPSMNQGGMGSGQGGFSSQAHSPRMGIYGQRPLHARGNQGGQQRDNPAEGNWSGSESYGGSGDAADVESSLRASGSSGVPEPLRYRRRVDEYLRRIAEELEDQR